MQSEDRTGYGQRLDEYDRNGFRGAVGERPEFAQPSISGWLFMEEMWSSQSPLSPIPYFNKATVEHAGVSG